jgi:hypothetical protein
MSEVRPVGELFTHVYLDRSVPLADSELFRRRLGGHCDHILYKLRSELARFVKAETGLTVPTVPIVGYRFEPLFVHAKIEHVLNLITIVWRFIQENVTHWDPQLRRNVSALAQDWLEFVRRAMREENLHYTVDEKCGVHYAVDQEFEHNRAATLRVLAAPRYSNARAAFEAAYTHLGSTPPDTKAAVRAMFEASEIVARQMVTAKNLHNKLVENELTRLALRTVSGDSTAEKVVPLLFKGFANWVDAVHHYRHGQGVSEPVAPSLEITVYLLRTGSAFLRWLVAINSADAAK